LKALSGYAEYFWLMGKNWKDVENRNWSLTRYLKREDLPVRVYLHASKTRASKLDIAFIRSRLNPIRRQEFDAVDWERYRGTIIGEVTISNEVTMEDWGMQATHSRWFFGTYGFVVEGGELYDTQCLARGSSAFSRYPWRGYPARTLPEAPGQQMERV